MNWKVFLQGLAAAAIGGAAAGATQAISTSGNIGKDTGAVAGAGALVAVLAFLKQSPLINTPPAPPEQPKQ